MELRSMGFKSLMLTGDSNADATFAPNQLENLLAEVNSEFLLEDKVRIVDELKPKDGPILMIGDAMSDTWLWLRLMFKYPWAYTVQPLQWRQAGLARMTHQTAIMDVAFPVAIKLAKVGLTSPGSYSVGFPRLSGIL